MKRFAASVMAIIITMCLSGLALDAQASPGDVSRGDQMVPSENGSGSGGGGDDGDNEGAGTNGGPGSDGGSGSDPGTGSGSGDPGAAPPGVSVPRVMLAGFVSTPAEVEAGQDFSVSFTLRNTSKRTRVQNIKVSLSSGEGAAFLPAGGSSSIFIDRISADDDSIQTMAFPSLPSLEERPYQMTLNVEYEDAVANAYQSQETVAVQIKQGIRADTSAPQVMPEMIEVGQDASVTFNIHKQARQSCTTPRRWSRRGKPWLAHGDGREDADHTPSHSGCRGGLARLQGPDGDAGGGIHHLDGG